MPTFDFTTLSPAQIVIAFMCMGFAVGMIVHWVAVAGTAARWALNSGS